MENLSYLLIDEKKDAVIIDPSWSYESIEKEIYKSNLSLKSVLLTHGHYDHSDGAAFFEKKGAPIYIGDQDIFLLNNPIKNPLPLKDGQKLFLLEKEILCLHTPGHSPGSFCFLCQNNLFTGDTIFPGYCGRVDLPGSNPKEMRESLIKIAKLDEGIKIYSGHSYNGGESTIKKEKESNPCFVNLDNEEDFFNVII